MKGLLISNEKNETTPKTTSTLCSTVAMATTLKRTSKRNHKYNSMPAAESASAHSALRTSSAPMTGPTNSVRRASTLPNARASTSSTRAASALDCDGNRMRTSRGSSSGWMMAPDKFKSASSGACRASRTSAAVAARPRCRSKSRPPVKSIPRLNPLNSMLNKLSTSSTAASATVVLLQRMKLNEGTPRITTPPP